MSAAKTKTKTPTTQALTQKARKGDSIALQALQAAHPDTWDHYARDVYGDFGQITEEVLTRAITGEDLVLQEGLRLKTKELKVQLAGPEPSVLERLLAERIVCCWLLAHHADAVYGQGLGNQTFRADEHGQKRQDRATRRFLQACKALAQVRKLMGPTIQVNVAENQLNVQGTPG